MRAHVRGLSSAFGSVGCLVMVSVASVAQGTQPVPPSVLTPKQDSSEKSMVINPTEEECSRGWNASMRWTSEQFTAMCTAMQKSK
jgi:hypothetical protein